jgi:DNA-binding transcriptional LysR family regulator
LNFTHQIINVIFKIARTNYNKFLFKLMELRTIRSFITLAEHLHFGRAANVLCISQPALTQQIKKLEIDVGTKLFVRQVGNLSLTSAGYALLPRAREMLRYAAMCYAAVSAQPEANKQCIRLSYPASAAHIIARMGLVDFSSSIPDLSIELYQGASAEAVSNLLRGDADIAITWLPLRPDAAGIESSVFYSVEMMVVLPASHRLGNQISVTWDDLGGETQLLFERSLNPAFYDLLRSPFANLAVKTRHMQRGAANSENFFAALGKGFSLSSTELDTTLLSNPTVRLIPVRENPLRVELAVHAGPGKISPIVRQFLNFIRAHANASAQETA